jgi:hypothetical protein
MLREAKPTDWMWELPAPTDLNRSINIWLVLANSKPEKGMSI